LRRATIPLPLPVCFWTELGILRFVVSQVGRGEGRGGTNATSTLLSGFMVQDDVTSGSGAVRMSSTGFGGPVPYYGNPHDFVAELRAQHEIAEDQEGICAAVKAAVDELKQLDAWEKLHMQRLAAEQQDLEKTHREFADLGDRRYCSSKSEKQNAIVDRQNRIDRERAEIERQREALEAIFVLKFLAVLGIPRSLLPKLSEKRGGFYDVGADPRTIPTSEYLQRAKVVAAFWVLEEHGWPRLEALEQTARELREVGVVLRSTRNKHREGLTTVEQIKEYAKDFKKGDYKKQAAKTQPKSLAEAAAVFATAWIDPATQPDNAQGHQATPRLSAWTESKSLSSLTGLQHPADVAQRNCERLLYLAEWHYAACLGESMAQRDAALCAARFILRLTPR
jgi:hypothetical protein